MLITLALCVVAATTAAARPPGRTFLSPHRYVSAFASENRSGATIPSETVTKAKTRVLSLARKLKEDSKTGVYLTDPQMKADLKNAVSELEAVCGSPTERSRQLMIGEWTLLCTTNTPSRTASGTRKKNGINLPFKLPQPPYNPLQDKIRNSFEITQRIRSPEDEQGEGESGLDVKRKETTINRIDNIIEFTPFVNTLEDILGERSPLNAFKDVKLNPLEVSKSKATLIHDAKVQSVSPVLRTKISLKSVVLTVAGTSQFLEAEGADVLGLNVPFGDFSSAGSLFDTIYVDETMRVTRGTTNFLDELRVFMRKGIYEDAELVENADIEEILSSKDEDEKSELQSSVEALGDAVQDAVKGVRGTIEDDIESVRTKVDNVRDTVEGAVKDVQEVIEGDIKKVQKSIEGVAEAVGDAAEDVSNTVREKNESIRDKAEDVVGAMRSGVGQSEEGLKDEISASEEEGTEGEDSNPSDAGVDDESDESSEEQENKK